MFLKGLLMICIIILLKEACYMNSELLIYFSQDKFKYLLPKFLLILIALLFSLSFSISFTSKLILIPTILLLGIILYIIFNYFYNIKYHIPMLIFNENGIYSHGLLNFSFLINWNHIENISIKNVAIYNSKFEDMLVIKLKHTYKKKNPIFIINIAITGGEYSFPNYLFENNFKLLINIIEYNSHKYNFQFNK